MILIAEFYARYSPTIEESQLRAAAESLVRFADRELRDFYGDRYDEYRVTPTVRVEVGSTKVWIAITALVGILTKYGDIRQSIDYLTKDVSALARLIIPGISRELGFPDQSIEFHQRRLGLPGKLRRLFEQVEHGEIAAPEAVDRAIGLLENEDGPDVIADLPRLKEHAAREFHHAQESSSETRGIPATQTISTRHENRPPLFPVPTRRDPVFSPVPGTGFRRRRKGVIARRNQETGHFEIYEY